MVIKITNIKEKVEFVLEEWPSGFRASSPQRKGWRGGRKIEGRDAGN